MSSIVCIVSHSIVHTVSFPETNLHSRKPVNEYILFSHSRKIATLTYRSGPEWNERFGRKRVHDDNVHLPRIDGAEFEIEDYIRHQVGIYLSSKPYTNSLHPFTPFKPQEVIVGIRNILFCRNIYLD